MILRSLSWAAALAALAAWCDPAAGLDPLNGDFSKANPLDVRVMTYNHNRNFIDNPGTDAAFDRILTTINPDIVCFQEFPSGVSAADVANRMDSILPTPGGWQIHFGLLAGIRTVIASRYTLTMTRIDTDPAASTRGVTIARADLPNADYPVDVYLLGVHLKCCGNPGGSEDAKRQDSADAIANWLGDARGVARPSGDLVVLPANTPMIALGDFNMVGGPGPENTILTGNILDEATYGPDVTGDWDGTTITDLHPIDPFTGDDFTWQGNGRFPPSRLDRIFYTDSAVTIAASFILNTDTMTPAALSAAGLQASDTLRSNSSDHLPVVVDLQIASSGCPDADGDGVCDSADICPGFNDNIDTDGDGVPDGCDICPGFDDNIDTDGDGVPDGCDPCPLDNPDDSDGDGVCDSADICPGFNDNIDTDGDGVPDGCDVCPGGDDNVDLNGNGIPDACECPADVNADGNVDLTDLAIVLGQFGRTGAGLAGDTDNDGDVDLSDLAAVLGQFGTTCTP